MLTKRCTWPLSPSVAKGYWGQDELTREAFQAELSPAGGDGGEGDDGAASNSARGPYLRTGDLGFLHEGQLYVCGRLKDLIIVRGRNHFPQDLERTAEQGNDALRPGCSAAFSVTRSDAAGQAHRREEGVVLVAEVRAHCAATATSCRCRAPSRPRADSPARPVQLRDPGSVDAVAVRDALRRQLAREHGVSLVGLALLKPRTITKTTSGKIARRRCRAAWTEGALVSVHTWAAGAGEEEVDGGAVEAEELGSPTEAPPSNQGGDSTRGGRVAEGHVGLDGAWQPTNGPRTGLA